MKTKGYDSMTSWFVAFACGTIGFLVVIPMRLAGFFFVIIIDQYGVDREKATIPIVVFGMLRSLTGPFIGYLGQTLGLRATTTLGCALTSVGIGICFFADDIIAVIIGLGFIYGLGLGLGVSLIPEILKQHFSKSVNTPFGIYTAGSCIGAIVMPKVLQLLKYEYGNSGMYLILSAIVLNSVPAALILKNPKNNNDFTKDETKSKDTNAKKWVTTRVLLSDDESGKQTGKNIDFVIGKNTSLPVDSIDKSRNSPITNKTSYDNHGFEFKDVQQNFKEDASIVANKRICESEIVPKEYKISNVNGKKEERLNIMFSKLSTKSKKVQSLRLFMNPTFYLTMFVQSCHGFVTTLTWTVIVDLGRDRGLSTELSLYFLMFFPVAEMVGALALNWVTNRGFMTQTYYCMTCYLILGFIEVCLIWVHDFASMMVCIMVFGLFSGSLVTTFPGMVYEFFDEEHHSMALTSRFVLYAVLCLTKSPIIGYFRGTMGSYDGVLYIIALSCVLSAILVTFTPFVASWRQKRILNKCELVS